MVMQAVKTDVQKSIAILVENALTALSEYMELSQEQVDKITQEMALAGLDSHMRLAKMAVEETGRGVLEDKAIKNMFATEYIYHSIKYEKTVGIVNENEHEDYYEVIEPVGVIAGVTPVTNPTSTTMFKSIIAAKTRNPIIFAFHPSAQKCSAESARILRDAAVKAGAPKHCIQWIETPSVEATRADGSSGGVPYSRDRRHGMVRSAYSCGKPLGVGPGNVPCFIERPPSSKGRLPTLSCQNFDNGMICASEQAVIIEQPVYRQAVEYMKEHNCYFTTPEETRKIEAAVMNAETCAVNPDIVGKSPQYIAKKAGIEIPAGTKRICCEIGGVGREYPLSYEKLSPVLAVIKARDAEHGIRLSEKMVEIGGLGHSSVIHSSERM